MDAVVEGDWSAGSAVPRGTPPGPKGLTWCLQVPTRAASSGPQVSHPDLHEPRGTAPRRSAPLPRPEHLRPPHSSPVRPALLLRCPCPSPGTARGGGRAGRARSTWNSSPPRHHPRTPWFQPPLPSGQERLRGSPAPASLPRAARPPHPARRPRPGPGQHTFHVEHLAASRSPGSSSEDSRRAQAPRDPRQHPTSPRVPPALRAHRVPRGTPLRKGPPAATLPVHGSGAPSRHDVVDASRAGLTPPRRHRA